MLTCQDQLDVSERIAWGSAAYTGWPVPRDQVSKRILFFTFPKNFTHTIYWIVIRTAAERNPRVTSDGSCIVVTKQPLQKYVSTAEAPFPLDHCYNWHRCEHKTPSHPRPPPHSYTASVAINRRISHQEVSVSHSVKLVIMREWGGNHGSADTDRVDKSQPVESPNVETIDIIPATGITRMTEKM